MVFVKVRIDFQTTLEGRRSGFGMGGGGGGPIFLITLIFQKDI